MIRHKRALAALLVTFYPLSVHAQGVETTGQVELEFMRGNDASSLLLSGDVMLRYRSGSFGGELGADSDFVLDGGGEYRSIYAAALFSTSFGEFAVGAPESAADLLIDIPSFAGMKAVDAGGILAGQPVTLGTPSMVGAIAKGQDAQSYGLRYTGSNGDIRYGVSIHRFDGNEDTILQAAAEYTTGQTQIEGMIENESLEGGFSGLIGVAHDQGPYTVSAYLSRQTITTKGTTFQLNGDYRMSDNLTLGGSFARKDFGEEQYLYGVTAGWGFGNGAYLSGGIADGDNTGLLMDASVGYKF